MDVSGFMFLIFVLLCRFVPFLFVVSFAAFVYSHRVVLARVPVLRLGAFDTPLAHLLVAADVYVWELAVFLYDYCNGKQCKTYGNN